MSEDKQKKGFALNPDGINKGGRPRGSRNKSSMMKAQYQLDEAAEIAVSILLALTTNDKATLGITTDVPPTVRLAASKEILNKVIANEKEKEVEQPTSKGKVEEEEDDSPLVLMHDPYAAAKREKAEKLKETA